MDISKTMIRKAAKIMLNYLYSNHGWTFESSDRHVMCCDKCPDKPLSGPFSRESRIQMEEALDKAIRYLRNAEARKFAEETDRIWKEMKENAWKELVEGRDIKNTLINDMKSNVNIDNKIIDDLVRRVPNN